MNLFEVLQSEHDSGLVSSSLARLLLEMHLHTDLSFARVDIVDWGKF